MSQQSVGHYDPSPGAGGVSRAGGVFPRRGLTCQAELHQDGDPARGPRAAGEPEHLGAEPGPDGECVTCSNLTVQPSRSNVPEWRSDVF